MVRFDSEEEFVAAMTGFQSWKSCLRVEVTVLKSVPSSAAVPAYTSTKTAQPAASTAIGNQGEDETEKATVSKATPFEVAEPAPSESSSIMSFVNDVTRSSISGATAKIPAGSAAPRPELAMAPPTSQSSRNAEDTFGPTAAELAATATTATTKAVSMASSFNSVAENVQASVDLARANTSGAVPVAPAQLSVVSAGNAPAATSASSSATPHEANGPVVHTGIGCDACFVDPIVGTRYKCAVRSDFDLCEACKPVAGADPPFPFLEIRTPPKVPSTIDCLLWPDQPANIEEASTVDPDPANTSGAVPAAPAQPSVVPVGKAPANGPVVHTGIRCDACCVDPIVGTRYKCAVRSDFDLCEACKPVAGADSPFPFLEIRTPPRVPSTIDRLLWPDQLANIEEASTVDPAPANTSGAVPAASAQPSVVSAAKAPAATPASASATPHEANGPAVHTGIRCDACCVNPIVGTRYKCAVRSNFDLCEACEPVVGADSPFPFLKIRTPPKVPSTIVCRLRAHQPASIEEASTRKHYRTGSGNGYKFFPSRRPDGGGELPEALQQLEKDMVEKIMKEVQQRGDPVTFDQIAGLEFAKKSVVEVVCWPMERPDIFVGLRALPKGLLLFGPPGTGAERGGGANASCHKTLVRIVMWNVTPFLFQHPMCIPFPFCLWK